MKAWGGLKLPEGCWRAASCGGGGHLRIPVDARGIQRATAPTERGINNVPGRVVLDGRVLLVLPEDRRGERRQFGWKIGAVHIQTMEVELRGRGVTHLNGHASILERVGGHETREGRRNVQARIILIRKNHDFAGI